MRSGHIYHWPATGLIDGRFLGPRRASLDVEPRCAKAVVEHDCIESDMGVAAGEGKHHEDIIFILNHYERSGKSEAEVGHDGGQSQSEIEPDAPVGLPRLQTKRKK